MKAWVLHGVNDLRLEEVPTPEIESGEVLVSVKAAGICGSDIPRIYQTGAHVHPLILGHEFSGEVVKTGPGADESWQGKRVGVFPLIPCKACVPCQRNLYEMCRAYSYLGSRRDGGFAEYTAVPAENLIELPENVSYKEAAMLEPMAVAVHALRRISPSPEDIAVVCGLGTIGLLLVMFLREAGIKNILAVGNKEFQKHEVFKLGITEECFCNSTKQDASGWLLERTGGVGTDIFFECVGKNETLNLSVSSTAPEGKICLVGNPASGMTLGKDLYWKILRSQLTVMGTWNSSFTHSAEDDWHYVLGRLENKSVMPETIITHRFLLDKLGSGFGIMRDKLQNYCKILMVRY